MKNGKHGSNTRSEKKKLERRKKREIQKRASSAPQLSRKTAELLGQAYDLIDSHEFEEAEALLTKLDKPGSAQCEVLELMLYLYQSNGRQDKCSEVAERLMKARPRDAEVHLAFAQASMFCGHIAIATHSYQEFVERWPAHEYVSKAKNALEILIPELEKKIKVFGFPKEHAVAWTILHEQALACMQRGNLQPVITKCEQLLALVPDFAPARNNLASAYFHTGRELEAVAIAEGTRKISPTSRFAEASLARLYFLTGREHDAHGIADNLVKDPPTDVDSITATLETLAFLGRDADIIALGTEAVRKEDIDKLSRGMQLHFLAYAHCRTGDIKTAKTLWNKCLSLYPNHPVASENLQDLETGAGHAPWADSFEKWIPKSRLDDILQYIENRNSGKTVTLLPALAVLIPAMLDRGDPISRELMTRLAKIVESPDMINALKDFAFSSRGPDKLRLEVMSFLQEGKYIESGTHLLYSNGKFTEVLIFSAEITSETPTFPDNVQELLDAGVIAMKKQDFDAAERSYQDVLTLDPDNSTAIYNLCMTWLNRDGKQGKAKATARLMKLREESPGYLLAPIALAQLAARDGDLKGANQLLASVNKVNRLRVAEAVSLFAAQADIALLEKKPEVAQLAYDTFLKFAEPNDPRVKELADRIALAKRKVPFRKLFSGW